MKCVIGAVVFLLCFAAPLSIASTEQPLLVITRPTVVAFFPPVDTTRIDEDTNEALADFQTYAARVRQPLRDAGIEFHELYAHSFRIRVGANVRTFRPGKVDVGYYFIAPGKEPRIEYGVDTDDGIMQVAREYFGKAMK